MAETWRPIVVDHPTDEAFCEVAKCHEHMMLRILDAILDRYDRNPDYHFIDTKLNLMTGTDFPPDGSPSDFRSRQVVYGWIQGRGLEALAGHARWLASCDTHSQKQHRIDRIHHVMCDVVEKMESIRERNDGRMSFMMRPDGQALQLSDQGLLEPLKLDPQMLSLSDLFYAKGLFAAVHELDWRDRRQAAETYFHRVIDHVATDRLATDQQSFDPKNKVHPVAGRRPQGPRMIGLFGICLMVERTGTAQWVRRGNEVTGYLLDHHIVRKRSVNLQIGDFVEAVDRQGLPWTEPDGVVLCDPGHALECVGAMARFLAVTRHMDMAASIRDLEAVAKIWLPKVFSHVFDFAWMEDAHGICKTYDLAGRRPVNDDMPWWSLPETIRAASWLLHLFPDHEESARIRKVIAACSNALLIHYVNPRVHLMAYQTRNAQGQPVDVVPATPDADPAYHTGLALIDFLRCFPPQRLT